MIGKFWYKETKDYVHVLDYYLFYPACGNIETHGCTCKCLDDDRRWMGLPMMGVKNPLVKILCGRHLDLVPLDDGEIYQRHYLITIGFGRSINITISDAFFADLGTPFYTVAHIPKVTGRV